MGKKIDKKSGQDGSDKKAIATKSTPVNEMIGQLMKKVEMVEPYGSDKNVLATATKALEEIKQLMGKVKNREHLGATNENTLRLKYETLVTYMNDPRNLGIDPQVKMAMAKKILEMDDFVQEYAKKAGDWPRKGRTDRDRVEKDLSTLHKKMVENPYVKLEAQLSEIRRLMEQKNKGKDLGKKGEGELMHALQALAKLVKDAPDMAQAVQAEFSKPIQADPEAKDPKYKSMDQFVGAYSKPKKVFWKADTRNQQELAIGIALQDIKNVKIPKQEDVSIHKVGHGITKDMLTQKKHTPPPLPKALSPEAHDKLKALGPKEPTPPPYHPRNDHRKHK